MKRSLRTQIQLLAEALVTTGCHLRSMSCNNTPAALRLFHWMKDIAPGHFVLEISSFRHRHSSIDRVGELIAINGAYEFTIRTVDGRKFHWKNAEFVRIPRNEADRREINRLDAQQERAS